jgi:hypothetical protein
MLSSIMPSSVTLLSPCEWQQQNGSTKLGENFGSTAMTVTLAQAAIDLCVAGALSAAIGFERQWRNRLAGLRTNTLVALGAATS